MIPRVRILRRAGEVIRLHTVSTIKTHTLADHVYGAQVIALELCRISGIPPGNVLEYLLIHDAPEVELGDIPAPVKWRSDLISFKYKEMEDQFYRMFDVKVPKLTELEMKIAKASDMLDLVYAMAVENEMGNGRPQIDVVFDNGLEYLKQYVDVPGVKDMMVFLQWSEHDL